MNDKMQYLIMENNGLKNIKEKFFFMKNENIGIIA